MFEAVFGICSPLNALQIWTVPKHWEDVLCIGCDALIYGARFFSKVFKIKTSVFHSIAYSWRTGKLSVQTKTLSVALRL